MGGKLIHAAALAASLLVLAVGRDPASYEPPCSKNVFYGDFDR
jgi:hypothetical protein